MPTALHRIQVLLRPDETATVKTLARFERRSESSMAAELIAAALKLPKFHQMLEEAGEDGYAVPAQHDSRVRIPQRQWRAG